MRWGHDDWYIWITFLWRSPTSDSIIYSRICTMFRIRFRDDFHMTRQLYCRWHCVWNISHDINTPIYILKILWDHVLACMDQWGSVLDGDCNRLRVWPIYFIHKKKKITSNYEFRHTLLFVLKQTKSRTGCIQILCIRICNIQGSQNRR